MSVGEVRERILSSVGTIPLIVNNLVKMNYVERMCNEKDRRVCILHLTQEGYDVISKIVPRNEAVSDLGGRACGKGYRMVRRNLYTPFFCCIIRGKKL